MAADPESPAAGMALSGLPLEELGELLRSSFPALPSFRSKQIFTALARGALSFGEIHSLPLTLRQELNSRFRLRSSAVSARLEDRDGTVKLQILLEDGLKIEAVLLVSPGSIRGKDGPEGGGRRTACLSTQAGCPAGCVFCKTGALSLARNLNSAEIVEQFLHIRSLCPGIDNIVIMGMGEPLFNLGALRKALTVLTSPEGLGISRRRITLSTCGIAGGIRDLAGGGPDLRLALSLTTAEEDLRKRLMPITRSNPLGEVKEALRCYQRIRRRRITLEAVLLGGINTRREDAEAMARFARGLETVVNLIPWNPVEGLCFEGRPLREPEEEEAAGFARELGRLGLKVTRRYRKGRGIAGACGQLGTARPETENFGADPDRGGAWTPPFNGLVR
ncbi:MAG: 23S rRNA (adenine(2503)-C(2))-methyltransferase RlmN [Treponema sp.]|jgi:23S rRNA (adenine2503-C2)-methyltransferase|nr:23S rRNA (adenine(2503)-C(2))-methyltransferase RlmN [Treponema sp.]